MLVVDRWLNTQHWWCLLTGVSGGAARRPRRGQGRRAAGGSGPDALRWQSPTHIFRHCSMVDTPCRRPGRPGGSSVPTPCRCPIARRDRASASAIEPGRMAPPSDRPGPPTVAASGQCLV